MVVSRCGFEPRHGNNRNLTLKQKVIMKKKELREFAEVTGFRAPAKEIKLGAILVAGFMGMCLIGEWIAHQVSGI